MSRLHCDSRYQKNHNHQQECKEYEVFYLIKVFKLILCQKGFDWLKTRLIRLANWKHFPNMNLFLIPSLTLELHIWSFLFFQFLSFFNKNNFPCFEKSAFSVHWQAMRSKIVTEIDDYWFFEWLKCIFYFAFLPSWYQPHFLPLPLFLGQRQKIWVLWLPFINPYPLHLSLHSCKPFLPTLHVGIMFSSLKSKLGSQPVHFENRWNQIISRLKYPDRKMWTSGPISRPMKQIKNIPFSRHKNQYFYFSRIEHVFAQLDAIPLYKINCNSLCYIWLFQHLLVAEIISLDCISSNQGCQDF